jgi:hypothetical protein
MKDCTSCPTLLSVNDALSLHDYPCMMALLLALRTVPTTEHC